MFAILSKRERRCLYEKYFVITEHGSVQRDYSARSINNKRELQDPERRQPLCLLIQERRKSERKFALCSAKVSFISCLCLERNGENYEKYFVITEHGSVQRDHSARSINNKRELQDQKRRQPLCLLIQERRKNHEKYFVITEHGSVQRDHSARSINNKRELQDQKRRQPFCLLKQHGNLIESGEGL